MCKLPFIVEAKFRKVFTFRLEWSSSDPLVEA